MLTEGHNSGVVVGYTDFTDAELEDVLHWALHANSAFITNGEDSFLLSAISVDVITNVSDDTGVSRTAHTFIRGEGNDELSGI